MKLNPDFEQPEFPLFPPAQEMESVTATAAEADAVCVLHGMVAPENWKFGKVRVLAAFMTGVAVDPVMVYSPQWVMN